MSETKVESSSVSPRNPRTLRWPSDPNDRRSGLMWWDAIDRVLLSGRLGNRVPHMYSRRQSEKSAACLLCRGLLQLVSFPRQGWL